MYNIIFVSKLENLSSINHKDLSVYGINRKNTCDLLKRNITRFYTWCRDIDWIRTSCSTTTSPRTALLNYNIQASEV